MRSRFAWVSLWVSLCLTACYGVPAQEVLGPRDTLARTEPEQRCERVVELIESNTTSRPYREVSRISVTCHPSARDMCQRRLRERACRLGADAVLVSETVAGTGDARPPYSQSQVSASGVAIAFR